MLPCYNEQDHVLLELEFRWEDRLGVSDSRLLTVFSLTPSVEMLRARGYTVTEL